MSEVVEVFAKFLMSFAAHTFFAFLPDTSNGGKSVVVYRVVRGVSLVSHTMSRAKLLERCIQRVFSP